MFIKPFKIKSNVQLKGSENKKLRSRIDKEFQNLSNEDILRLIPNKATVTQVKLTTYGNISCNAYAVDKRPMFFEEENGSLVPTVYAVWETPNIVPYFTTHPTVLPRLANGADLMLPGVIQQGTGLSTYGHYKKDSLIGVNLTSNKAAVGIGRLARSSDDLYMSAGVGICVKMIHVFGDKLWGLEPTVTMQIPNVGAVLSVPTMDDFPELGSTPKKRTEEKHVIENKISEIAEKQDQISAITESDINLTDVREELCEIETMEVEKELTMDDILKNAFLTALKYDSKKLSLPLLTSNFYRLHVLPAADTQIDLKQTSYKKLSKFLGAMTEKGFIVVREETKGVEKIYSIDFEHPELVNFIPNSQGVCNGAKSNESQLFQAAMTESYVVTDETFVFFSKLEYKKGDGIEGSTVRKLLKEYISKNKLPSVNNTKIISLDPTLATICERCECTFEEIYNIVLSKMFHTYEMKSKTDVKSGNKPGIQMSLANRSGNKKVTLVTNLEAYGIILSEFAKSLKLSAAASTSIIKTANQKQNVLQVQGNQVKLIFEILTETYKIPPRQITGLDLAKKEKKKK